MADWVGELVGSMVSSTMQKVLSPLTPNCDDKEKLKQKQKERLAQEVLSPANTEPELENLNGEFQQGSGFEANSDYDYDYNYDYDYDLDSSSSHHESVSVSPSDAKLKLKLHSCPPSLSQPLRLMKTEVRKVLLLYNPHSGAQKGAKIATQAKEIFEQNLIKVHAVPLQYSGHAQMICKNFDFTREEIDVVVALGGDGTFHECVNGLMKRSDHSHLLSNLPLALIAGGTGNSFALELMGESNPQVTRAVKHIIRGISAPIDIARLTFPIATTDGDNNNQQQQSESSLDSSDDRSVYSFNSIHWGLASQVNVNAEKLRWLGHAARYTTAALYTLMQGQKQRALIVLEDANGRRIEYNEEFCLVIANNIASALKGMKMAPDAKLNDGLIDLLLVRSSSTLDLMTIFRKVFDGTHTELPSVEYRQVRKFSIIPFKNETAPPASLHPKTKCENATINENTEFIEELLDVDGELKGQTPFVCEVVPLAIRVIL